MGLGLIRVCGARRHRARVFARRPPDPGQRQLRQHGEGVVWDARQPRGQRVPPDGVPAAAALGTPACRAGLVGRALLRMVPRLARRADRRAGRALRPSRPAQALVRRGGAASGSGRAHRHPHLRRNHSRSVSHQHLHDHPAVQLRGRRSRAGSAALVEGRGGRRDLRLCRAHRRERAAGRGDRRGGTPGRRQGRLLGRRRCPGAARRRLFRAAVRRAAGRIAAARRAQLRIRVLLPRSGGPHRQVRRQPAAVLRLQRGQLAVVTDRGGAA